MNKRGVQYQIHPLLISTHIINIGFLKKLFIILFKFVKIKKPPPN